MAQESYSIASLFGLPTPDEYGAYKRQQDLEYVTQAAPKSGAEQLMLLAGRKLGDAANNWLGNKDPELQRVTKVHEIGNALRQQVQDPSNPDEVFPTMIKMLQENGLTKEALLAGQQYEALQQQRWKLSNDTTKANADWYNALNKNRELKGKVLDPKFKLAAKTLLNKDINSIDDLSQDEAITVDNAVKNERIKTPEAFAEIGKSLGITPKYYLQDYSDEDARRIQQQIDATKERHARAGATRVSNNSKLEYKGAENVLEVDQEDAKAYRTMREASTRALTTLSKMADNYRAGVVTGTLADNRLDVLRVLDTFGLDTSTAKNELANTENFNKQVGELVRGIIKQYGQNPSNVDLQFAMQSLPSIGNSPEGLRRLINGLIKEHQDNLQEANRALSHYRANKGSFEGFEAKRPLATPISGLSTMSDEEFFKQYKKRKQGQ